MAQTDQDTWERDWWERKRRRRETAISREYMLEEWIDQNSVEGQEEAARQREQQQQREQQRRRR